MDLLYQTVADVLSTLMAALVVLVLYAQQRAARLRNALLNIDTRMTGLVEGDSNDEETRLADLLELFKILEREITRTDAKFLAVSIKQELKLKNLRHQSRAWRNRLNSNRGDIALLLRIRLGKETSEYREFRDFLGALRVEASRLGLLSFFEF